MPTTIPEFLSGITSIVTNAGWLPFVFVGIIVAAVATMYDTWRQRL